jgi:hypothetical protein
MTTGDKLASGLIFFKNLFTYGLFNYAISSSKYTESKTHVAMITPDRTIPNMSYRTQTFLFHVILIRTEL